MTSLRSSVATRRRSTIITVVCVAALVALGACGSDESTDSVTTESDGSIAGTSAPVSSADPSASDPNSSVAGGTETSAPTSAPSDGTGDPTATCGGISAADVGAAAGVGDFDSADDLSVDADVTCLFSNSTSVFGVTVASEPTSSFLAGEVDGLPIEEALTQLASTQTLFLEEGYLTEQITVAGVPAVVVTGIDLIQGQANGFAATVIDGSVHTVTASGTDLGTEPASFRPIVSSVLELAVGAQQ
jgi:hypothetical protein